MVGSRNTTPTIKNLDSTIIELEPARDQSLAKDIIEIFTGISTNAATAGGKITAGMIIYSEGDATPDQRLANNIFWIGSLIASVLDFLMIPLGYLYKFFKKETVPFNFENNTKWILAGITLLLAIISAAASITSRVISFISAGLAIVVGIASVYKYFYDYQKTGREFQAAVQRVETLTERIQMNMDEINHLQDQIRLLHTDHPANKNHLYGYVIQLAKAYRTYNLHGEELKASYYAMHHLERKFIRQKSPVELISNTLKFVLAGVVLAGTVLTLNPVTAAIGMGMLASAALLSLVTIIAKKTIQIIQKRIERDHEKKRQCRIKIPLNSTSALFHAFQAAAPPPEENTSIPRPNPAYQQPNHTDSAPALTVSDNKNDNNDEVMHSPRSPYCC